MVTKWDTRPQEKRDTPLYLQCRDSDFHPHFGFETHNTRAFGPQPLILKHTTLGPSALYFWFWKASPFGITEATLRLYLTAVCLPWCRKASPLIQKIWRLLGTQNSENSRSTISQCVTPHYELLDRGKIAEYNSHTPPPPLPSNLYPPFLFIFFNRNDILKLFFK